MDIVIPLGTRSQWDDNELRYALRSIEKNCINVDQIWIIGERPAFLSNAIRHIPFLDSSVFPATNIMNKILRVCQEPELSEKFLFSNDDIFINKLLDIELMPYLYQGNLARTRHRDGNYAATISNTFSVLNLSDLPYLHFDIHTPIIYSKNLFPEIMHYFDWSINHGYAIKSLYCNTAKIPPTPYIDNKIRSCLTYLNMQIAFRYQFTSIGDRAVCDSLFRVMNEMYPAPSKFEISEK